MKVLLSFVFVIAVFANSFGQKLFAAKKDEKYGYVDVNGNWVISPVFEDAYAFVNGFGRVKRAGRWSYVRKNAAIITPFRFSKVSDFEGDVARVTIFSEKGPSLCGLIDTIGRPVGNAIFRDITKFSEEGLAMAEAANGDWGFIDKKGNWVIQPVFGGLRGFSNGLAMARRKGKWGYIDEKGIWVIEPIYDHVHPFKEGVATVSGKDGWIMINKKGQRMSSYPFDVIKPFSEGVAVAREDRWGVVGTHGGWIIGPSFSYLHSFKGGLARARENLKWGMIDKHGEWVIRPEFRNIQEMSEGIILVQRDMAWGYLDRSGKWIVEPRFQEAGKFLNGSAVVKIRDKWGIIDKTGKFTAEAKFDELRSLLEDEEEIDL